MKSFGMAAIFAALFFQTAQAAESLTGPHVKISVLAPTSFGAAKDHVAFFFEVDPEWHVYWKNPGDSGAAPKFQMEVDGATLGPILWPRPHRIPVSHLTNLGYDNEVAFPFAIDPQGKKIRLTAKLEWLVCKEECIPGFGTLTIERPVVGKESKWESVSEERLRRFLELIPAELGSPWKIEESSIQGSNLRLKVLPESEEKEAPDVFSEDGNAISPAAPLVAAIADGGWNVDLPLIEGAELPKQVDLVLASKTSAWRHVGVSLETRLPTAETEPFWFLLLSAFLGGILLNLMPCVFPVLSIKLFTLMKATKDRKERLREGILYTAGVVTAFAALGAGFLLLRAAGSAIGWGFQLQSPPVIFALILLFWLMSLNFLGVFEWGMAIMNRAGASKSASAFATGLLSVFVAAPCTGPFMGSALGAAAVLPALPAMLIFVGLALGLAAPFLLLAAVPRWADRLPRPGAWMETLKQFLAFPLLGTVVWLMWVLGLQTGTDGWFWSIVAMLVTSFALWLGRSKRTWVIILAWALGLASVGLAWQKIRTAAAPKAVVSALWIPYDGAKIKEARVQKQAVFVDFTAAWCITCQVNKKNVLETSRAESLFRENNVLTMRADWTQPDPVITAALAEFGRSSVPVYAYYPPEGDVRLLPQILTITMIEELFNNGGSK